MSIKLPARSRRLCRPSGSLDRPSDCATKRDRHAIRDGLQLGVFAEWHVFGEVPRQALELAGVLEGIDVLLVDTTTAAVARDHGGGLHFAIAANLDRDGRRGRHAVLTSTSPAHDAPAVAAGDTSSAALMLEQRDVPRKRLAVDGPERNTACAVLLCAQLAVNEPAVVDDLVSHDVAIDDWLRRSGHILHQEPARVGLEHTPLELGYQIAESRFVAVMAHHDRQSTEGLARWPADHAVESSAWRVKAAHIATPEWIGAADDAESLLLEGHIEQANARKQRQDERGHLVDLPIFMSVNCDVRRASCCGLTVQLRARQTTVAYPDTRLRPAPDGLTLGG